MLIRGLHAMRGVDVSHDTSEAIRGVLSLIFSSSHHDIMIGLAGYSNRYCDYPDPELTL